MSFLKSLPGFQKFFKNLLCQNSQISLNFRSAADQRHRDGQLALHGAGVVFSTIVTYTRAFYSSFQANFHFVMSRARFRPACLDASNVLMDLPCITWAKSCVIFVVA